MLCPYSLLDINFIFRLVLNLDPISGTRNTGQLLILIGHCVLEKNAHCKDIRVDGVINVYLAFSQLTIKLSWWKEICCNIAKNRRNIVVVLSAFCFKFSCYLKLFHLIFYTTLAMILSSCFKFQAKYFLESGHLLTKKTAITRRERKNHIRMECQLPRLSQRYMYIYICVQRPEISKCSKPFQSNVIWETKTEVLLFVLMLGNKAYLWIEEFWNLLFTWRHYKWFYRVSM